MNALISVCGLLSLAGLFILVMDTFVPDSSNEKPIRLGILDGQAGAALKTAATNEKSGENKMSWSVSVSGKIADVRGRLSEQFKGPLAEKPAGLADDGERETVRLVSETIDQCLGTFDSERSVSVTANGHMGYSDWDTKAGANQTVNVSIVSGI